MFGLEPDFLAQFAVHGLFRGFTPVDATLRELPRVGAYPFAPEDLVSLVEQNDADVGPKAVPVKHNQPQIFELSPLCTAHAVPAKRTPPPLRKAPP